MSGFVIGPIGVLPTASAAPAIFTGANVPLIDAAFTAGTYTFNNINGGIPFPAGSVVVLGYVANSRLPAPSALIGSTVTPTLIAAAGTGFGMLYYAVMTSSTADTFSITTGGAESIIGVACVYMTGVNSSIASQDVSSGGGGGTQNLVTGITVPASGFGIVMAAGNNGISADTWTTASPSNVTSSGGDTYISGFTNWSLAMAHITTPGLSNPQVALSSFGTDMVGAAWGP